MAPNIDAFQPGRISCFWHSFPLSSHSNVRLAPKADARVFTPPHYQTSHHQVGANTPTESRLAITDSAHSSRRQTPDNFALPFCYPTAHIYSRQCANPVSLEGA